MHNRYRPVPVSYKFLDGLLTAVAMGLALYALGLYLFT